MRYKLIDNEGIMKTRTVGSKKEAKDIIMTWLDDSEDMCLKDSKKTSLEDLLEIVDFSLEQVN
jgi:hypothetical protein